MKKLGFIILFFIGFTKLYADCTTDFVAVPVVKDISVDVAGNVTICWEPVVDVDGIDYYTIYMINPFTGANVFVDDVLVGMNCYTISAANNNSDTEIIELAVKATDVCGNPSAISTYINTILLKDTFDQCSASVLLEWNAYDDFVSGTNVLYNIYVNINSGGYNLYTSTTSLDTIYENIIHGDIYEFYIEAKDGGGLGLEAATSNAVLSNTTDAVKPPDYNYLFTTNVIDSTQISIQVNVDITADVTEYSVKRATSLNGNYTTVGSIPFGTDPSPIFTDNTEVKAGNTSYYYKVYPIDICGVEGDPYNFGRTILIDVKSSPLDAVNTISITPYEGWDNGVEKYELFRAVGGIWETGPLATFSDFTGVLVYKDDITKAFYGDGEFCYKVIAYENAGIHTDGLSIQASSLSNEACAFHEPILFVPNAFIPNSAFNPKFKPVLTFADPEAYFLQVYNKWGDVIFETKDVNESWNGQVNNSGADCQQDMYIYLLEFISADGDNYSKRGKITLLR